jgi:hypothetical protein
MEEEPWDELCGPPPAGGAAAGGGGAMSASSSVASSSQNQQQDEMIIQGVQRNLAHEVTTAPTRSYPPMAAFQVQVHKDPPAPVAAANDNYSEQGDEYDEDEMADEFNVASAASIRQEALKMLEVADDHLAGSPYAVHRTLSGGFTATHRLLSGGRSHVGEYDIPNDANEHDDDDGEYGMVGTRWSGSRSGSGRRLPAALAGLAYTASTAPASSHRSPTRPRTPWRTTPARRRTPAPRGTAIRTTSRRRRRECTATMRTTTMPPWT